MSCRVLVVEDNVFFRHALVGALRARFPALAIVEACDLAQGRQEVVACAPDLVLLDISLPDGNGLALAEFLRVQAPSAAVVVCTSYDLAEYREGASRCGAKHFMSKDNVDWEAIGSLVAGEISRKRESTAATAQSALADAHNRQ